MTIAIYPGSFDPFTNGHLDILKSGSEIFEKVIIAVSYNVNKEGFLPIAERVDLIKKCVNKFPNVEVDTYQGLTVDYAKTKGAQVLLRGLRTSFDFEYELQLSQTNNTLDKNLKTIFLITKPEFNYISSSMVREVLVNKGDISKFVPDVVNEYLVSKYGI
ncbi:MAG: pantetheine-phosphate adenylyltransferase [Cyanobacteria bacterium SIG28]|nr:pantetheine-phosphate adenylyltransferase [Cyanobacteria bacterium SIG28]